MNLSNLITLKTFNLFSEYFLGVSALYILIVTVLISYNVLGLIIQRSISNCMGLILLFACYLIINDDMLYCETIYMFNCSNFLGFYKSVVTDNFGSFAKFILCFFSAVYFFIVSDFLKDYKITSFEYLLILLFAVIGLLLLCTSNDLLSAYLAIELVSLSSYLLASFKKNSSYSVEAGIKYLIIGSISSAFFLLGSSFIYASLGIIYIDEFESFFDRVWIRIEWNAFIGILFSKYGKFCQLFAFRQSCLIMADRPCDYPRRYLFVHSILYTYRRRMRNRLFMPWHLILQYNKNFFECINYLELYIEIGLTFVIFSLFIKLALAPFHTWSLDVYEGSPAISTFFFAVVTKLSIFIFLTRICYSAFYFKEFWQFYAVIVGFLSVFVGSFGGLRQKKLKTLLAYSSTSHMGYTLLSFSTCSQFGVEMILFYLIIYMLSGITIWFIILSVRENKKSYANKFNKELGDFALLRESNPALAISLSIAMFSIAGIPPFIGFFAKLNIFLSMLRAKYYLIAFLTILCSVISTFYYIRIIKILYFENVLVGKLYYSIKTNKIIFFTAFMFALFFLFTNPTLLYVYTYKVVWKSFYVFKYH